jgi:putative DNA primase/helicase
MSTLNRGNTSPPQEPDRRRAALVYGECLEERVIPLYTIHEGACTCPAGILCTAPGKHPIIENWPVYASSNTHRIKVWFNQVPPPNIGLLQGWLTVALDVDDPAALAALETQYGKLPETVTQFTGRPGGCHYLFRNVGGLGNSGGVLPPGIDFRGANGFIVAAPSRHISGEFYRWDPKHHRLHHPIAEMPDWLLELIRARPAAFSTATPKTAWAEFLATDCLEGRRNKSLARYLGHLLAHRHRPEEAFQIA